MASLHRIANFDRGVVRISRAAPNVHMHRGIQMPRRPATIDVFTVKAIVNDATSDSPLSRVGTAFHAFYKFTRPHTMAGTFISIASVSLLALGSSAITAAATNAFAFAVTSALLMNVCIVGLNQLYDVDIDKINKPYLPLASGEMSMQTGQAVVVGSGVASLAIGVLSGSWPLVWTLVTSLALGIVYSTELPFLRWKKYPALAAACILSVRAVIVQIGFYLHMQQALGTSSIALTPALMFTVSFMVLFSVVIALFKDLPDVLGDRQAGVHTFSVRLGVPTVFWTCVWLLTAAYVGAVVFSLSYVAGWKCIASCLGHAAVVAMLWSTSRAVNLTSTTDITNQYMFVWKLFYAEYLLIPMLQ